MTWKSSWKKALNIAINQDKRQTSISSSGGKIGPRGMVAAKVADLTGTSRILLEGLQRTIQDRLEYDGASVRWQTLTPSSSRNGQASECYVACYAALKSLIPTIPR